jgi:hypothetical protein
MRSTFRYDNVFNGGILLRNKEDAEGEVFLSRGGSMESSGGGAATGSVSQDGSCLDGEDEVTGGTGPHGSCRERSTRRGAFNAPAAVDKSKLPPPRPSATKAGMGGDKPGCQ